MEAGFPQSEWHKREQEKNWSVICDLTLKDMHSYFSNISHSLLRPAPLGMGGDYTRSSGAILEACYHTNFGIKFKVQKFMIYLSLDVNDSP